MEGTMGVVTMVAYDFSPKGWMSCNGQLLSVSQNQALFSILGTTFGGDGQTSFGLPDLRGRAPVGSGTDTTGQGLSTNLGQVTGQESVTMTVVNMPAHAHDGVVGLNTGASNQDGDQSSIENTSMGGNTPNAFSTNANANFGAALLAGTIAASGGSAPFSNLMPYLTVNYIICTQGIYPSRN